MMQCWYLYKTAEGTRRVLCIWRFWNQQHPRRGAGNSN